MRNDFLIRLNRKYAIRDGPNLKVDKDNMMELLQELHSLTNGKDNKEALELDMTPLQFE